MSNTRFLDQIQWGVWQVLLVPMKNMMFIVATNVVASQMPERQPILMPIACANN